MRVVLLPEREDVRVQEAARRVAAAGAIQPAFIASAGETAGVGDDGILRCVPQSDNYGQQLREAYLPKRELSDAEVAEMMQDGNHIAALMLKNGEVDAVVSGAVGTTADTVRAALRVVKLESGIRTLSSFFLMQLPERYGRPPFMMADCALVIEPDEAQLFDISVSSAKNAERFLDETPRIALLSFSTAGSSEHAQAQKIRAVSERLRQERPDLCVAGEVQADAALNPEIAARKGLEWERPANVLIFPDLNAGNIAYKIVQQMTGCVAIGPVLQGLQKPFNDLSRGASAADIEKMIELSARQAGG